jgi:hypothetical protein
MAAFWAVFTFGGSGPALTAHGSLDLKQEIQIQIQIQAISVQRFYHKLYTLKVSSFSYFKFPSANRHASK